MNKLNSFVKEFIAVAKGDDVEAMGQKAWRGAESALKVQIATRDGDTVSLEDEVEKAKEALKIARVNGGVKITNRSEYISNLIDAKNTLTSAEEDLADHHVELDFLKAEYEMLEGMEDVKTETTKS